MGIENKILKEQEKQNKKYFEEFCKNLNKKEVKK